MESLARLVVTILIVSLFVSFGLGILISLNCNQDVYKYASLVVSLILSNIFLPAPLNIKFILNCVLVSGFIFSELLLK
jgi:hypothetical protein